MSTNMSLVEITKFEDSLFDKFYDSFNKKQKTKIVFSEKPKVNRFNRKTVFSNFTSFVNTLKTDINTLKKFFDSESGYTSSLDSNNHLIINGMVQINKVMSIIKSFIDTFIKCPQCTDTDTNIIKEKRIDYIFCNVCTSKTAIDIKKYK